MSHYITVSDGTITFDTHFDMEQAIKPLVDGGWLEKALDGYYWIDERRQRITGNNVQSASGRSLCTEQSDYLNLTVAIRAVADKSTTGYFAFVNSDEGFDVEVWRNGERRTISDRFEIIRRGKLTGDDLDLLDHSAEEWEDKHPEDDYCAARGEIIAELINECF